ncbi:MAG: hypothetical protein IT183_14255 [Acidobacteria bacterium]|nr:hypothetical protein [Acidobacteriota bacterium]
MSTNRPGRRPRDGVASDRRIEIRVTPGEHALIAERAAANRESISDFVRGEVLTSIEESDGGPTAHLRRAGRLIVAALRDLDEHGPSRTHSGRNGNTG